MKKGEKVDLAVVSDRENDTIVIFRIDPVTRALSDITGKVNNNKPLFTGDGEDTAYGLATYVSPGSGKTYAFVSRREGPFVRQLELVTKNKKIDAVVVRTISLGVPAGLELEDALAEAMVVDQEAGKLYVAQEQFGILKFSAEPNGGNQKVIVDTVEGPNMVADAEGLTIYYAANGKGYLLASSQGDSTINIYERDGANAFVGKFMVGPAQVGNIDSAEETDGAHVVNVPLGPDFPYGMLVVQDGNDDPQYLVDDDGELENAAGNFKYIPWEHVASAFFDRLTIDTTSYDPRGGSPALLSTSGTSIGSAPSERRGKSGLPTDGILDLVRNGLGRDLLALGRSL
jgi:3-phytase